MWFEDSFLWPIMIRIGRDDVWGEILVRKFHHVYYDWYFFLFMILATGWGIAFLSKKSPVALQTTWKQDVMLALYIVMGGLLFFNTPFLTHSMLAWGVRQYIQSVVWSLLIAGLPAALIYAGAAQKQRLSLLALIPVIHSLLALIYIANPICAIE